MSKSASSLSTIVGSLIALLTLILGGLLSYHYLNKLLLSAVQPGLQSEESFVIEKGWDVKVLAQKLAEKEIIEAPLSLELLARLQKNDKGKRGLEVSPGEYPIHAGLSPSEIVEILRENRVVYHTVSIPEGFTISEIALLMSKTGLCTLEEAQKALKDKSLMSKYRIPTSSMEGYLFPETYKFSRPEGAFQMVDRMLSQGSKTKTPERIRRADEIKLSWHQVLTLASIIEKETGRAEERPTISSVFHNRLRIGMPLQTDPTVIYGIKNFDGNLTKKHLRTPSLYNTYINKGLTPTPIASPGLAAIDAALYPSDTEFLYFVSKGDGSHVFSKSYNEHRKYVKQYQRGKETFIEPPEKAPVRKKVAIKKKKIESKPKPAAKPKKTKSKKTKRPVSQLDFDGNF